jgi:nitrite reductase/ring-hydroxylating ferredoxin subunit
MDPSAALEMYPVEIRSGEVFIQVPLITWDNEPVVLEDQPAATEAVSLQDNEFRLEELEPGQVHLVLVKGKKVAIYNFEGSFYATQDACTHEDGPLSEGKLDGNCIICPLHDSSFDVRDGSVQKGPATEPLKRYRVVVTGSTGRIEELVETGNGDTTA